MKKCSKCKDEKELDEFYKNKRKKDGLQDLCIICKKEQDKKHWDKHKIKWIKYYVSIQKDRSKLINKLKEDEGCKKCNDKRYWVLDFHHIDPSNKEYNIGTGGRSIKTLLKEIEKCIVLCKNCHAEFHYLERNNKIDLNTYTNILIEKW